MATVAKAKRVKEAQFSRQVMLIRPRGNGVSYATLRLTVGRKSGVYLADRIPCEIGGEGFAFLSPEGKLYHVRLDGENTTCDCTGHEAHGYSPRGRCKHVYGAQVASRRGWL